MSEVPRTDRVRQASSPVLVAVDLGAESCRVSLLRWNDGQPEIRLVHRFPNSARTGKWPALGHRCHRKQALKRACGPARNLRPKGSLPSEWTVGPWTMFAWARRRPVANPFCYRDERTVESQSRCTRGFLPTAFIN